jgi:hypothetical protein
MKTQTMKTTKYSIAISDYEYDILTKNEMIAMICEEYLKTATRHNDSIELSLTLKELEDLTGYAAAESNHARSWRKQEELGAICDYLESQVSMIKRGQYK